MYGWTDLLHGPSYKLSKRPGSPYDGTIPVFMLEIELKGKI